MGIKSNVWKTKLHLPGKVLTDAQLDELLDDAEKGKWIEHKSFMQALDKKVKKEKPRLKNNV